MIFLCHILSFFRPRLDSARRWVATYRSAWCALALAVLASWSLPTRADVWGYVDAKDLAHFSSERLDERYELFFKANESFSFGKVQAQEAQAEATPAASTVKNVATATLARPAYTPPKRLAHFNVSPHDKAVRYLLKEASLMHGIDYELLQALIATESGFDTHAVSPKGAVGLMQLIPPTAERYGVKADKTQPIEQKLTDPKTNIQAGSRYLRDLIKLFPNQLELAVAAYNAGEGAVQRAGNKIPNYPETKNYVKTVMQLYNHLKPPMAIAPDVRQSASRVRVEMMGGAVGSRRTVAQLTAPLSGSLTTQELLPIANP